MEKCQIPLFQREIGKLCKNGWKGMRMVNSCRYLFIIIKTKWNERLTDFLESTFTNFADYVLCMQLLEETWWLTEDLNGLVHVKLEFFSCEV